MASDPHDPLGRALDELRADVTRVNLAAPADVRARGDQRTRRHRAAMGASTAVAVAAIAVGASVLPGSLRSDGTPVPPAGTTPTASASPSPTSASSPTSSSPSGPRPVISVTPVGVGHVAAAYFLPGKLWTGPDLMHGATLRSIEPKEFEGSVQRFTCDPDGSLTGNVAFVQAVRADGTFAGTQKVRLLPDARQAAGVEQQSVAGLLACQQRLRQQAQKDAETLPPGETAPNPTAEVTEDTSARVDDATGSVRLFRTVTDYGTGAGSRLIEWVAVVAEGRAVSLISLNQFDEGDVSFAALQRVASEARAQLAWAATR